MTTMSTTDAVEPAEQKFNAEVAHLEGVLTNQADRRGELEASEGEYKKLAYEFSRCENGKVEGVEAELQAVRESRSRIKDEIAELELVQTAAQEEVARKGLVLDLARHDKAAAECRKLLEQKVADAKKVTRAVAALGKTLATFSFPDRAIYNLAHECGLDGARLNWLGNSRHVEKSLAASLYSYLGDLLESRPDPIFREESLYQIEADRNHSIEQDLDRTRARIVRNSGNPNGNEHG